MRSQQPGRVQAMITPSRVDWPDGAVPNIELNSDAVVLDVGLAPRDLFGRPAPAAPRSAGLGDAGVGATGVARESALDLPLRLQRAPRPTYHEWLRRAGFTGVVTVEFVVDTAGRVEPASIEVIHATREAFGEAVIGALEDARFSPGTVRGKPVRVKVRQDFRFRIGG